MLGTLAGLRKIGVGAVRQRMRVAMRQLALHRIVAVLFAIVGLERTFSTVRIVFQMIGGVVNQGFLPRMRGFKIIYSAPPAYAQTLRPTTGNPLFVDRKFL